MRHQVIDDLVTRYIPENAYAEQWDAVGLRERLREVVALDAAGRGMGQGRRHRG